MQRWASSARLAHAWTPTATKREAQLVLCKCFDGQEFGAGLRALGLELAARGARGALAVFRLLCGSPRPQPDGDFDSMTWEVQDSHVRGVAFVGLGSALRSRDLPA